MPDPLDLLRLSGPAGALCVCAMTDPQNPKGFFVCPFKLLTGLPCPFCGMTRSVASLLRMQWDQSVSFHIFGPAALVALAVWLIFELGRIGRLWRGEPLERFVMQPWPWITFLGLCSIYDVLRWWGILGVPRL